MTKIISSLSILFFVFNLSIVKGQNDLDSLLQIWSDKQEQDTVRLAAIENLLGANNFQLLEEHPDSAMALSNAAYDFAVSIKRADWEAQIQHLQASLFEQTNEYELAIVYLGHLNAQTSASLFYQKTDNFQESESKLFKGILVQPLSILSDTSQNLTIDDIRENKETLLWLDVDGIAPQPNVVYWLHTTMVGSNEFKGQHVFHVSHKMGDDISAFDYIDIYAIDQYGNQAHIKTGRSIPVKEKPIYFWSNLIPIEIDETDTLDVFIKLAGVNMNYPLYEFNLWHLDFEDLITKQMSVVAKSSIFYGILGIQIVFFVFLFLISQERIYLYFSVFGTGLFLSRAFQSFNYESFIPFPSLIPYSQVLYHSSMYLSVFGGVLFVSQYLKISKDSIFMRRVVPFYLIITFISYARFIFRYHFSEDGGYPAILTPAFYTLSALFLGIYMILFSPKSELKSKLLLILAIIPIILGGVLTIVFNEGWLPEAINGLFVDDMMKLGVIFLVVTLGLIVGFKSRLLKAERDQVKLENLKAKHTIVEKQLRTEKLEELNELKTRLYTNITHEFRTPLTVIMGVNDELMETNQKSALPILTKEKINQNQKLIQHNSKNLLNLVNQLLDLSKSDNQKLKLNVIQADIIPFLNYLTQSFFSKAKEKKIQLIFYSDIPSVLMDYDEQKIQHLVYNLLSNALKFTLEDGKIVMHASLLTEGEQSSLILKIVDNGIGIPEEKLPFIFDRFYQVDDTHTRQVDGSGIGLSLVKEIVFLMHGDITVQSEMGMGTSFIIQLPIRNSAEIVQEQKLVNTPMECVPDIDPLNDEFDFVSHVTDEDKAVVLLVEDNQDVATYIRQILQHRYRILLAANGELGIEKALEIIPDIIISDVMMPKKDGYELTKTLKSDTRTSHIPIILLTAKATAEAKLAGLKTGADVYLTKPFNKEELFVRLENSLQIRTALQRKISENLNVAEKSSSASTELSMDEVFIQKLKTLVQSNLNNPDLNIERLCKEVGIGQSQLYRKLKAIANETPNSFIRNIRLRKAKELLKTSDLNISEIAYDVGFNDPNYFSRSFHKLFSKAPSDFRDRQHQI